ncbi:MAG: GTP-binding protein [Nannocystaceae bacterium]
MTPAGERPPLTVAAIGPSREGKTTLAAALSRILGPRGGARVLSFSDLTRGGHYLGHDDFATQSVRWLEYSTETWRIAHLDLAASTRRAITRLAPLSWAEALLLVISPSSGATLADASTVEHLRVAAHQGVTRVIVFLNQCDRHLDVELLDLAELEARALLDACGFVGDEAPVIRGAARPALEGDPRWTRSIHELAEAIDRWFVAPPRDPAAPLRMSVLRGFRIAGRGVVAAGRVERGVIRSGDPIDLAGASHHRWITAEDRITRLRRTAGSVRAFDRGVPAGRPGDLVGVLVRGREGELGSWRESYRVSRGLSIGAPDSLALRRLVAARVRLLTPAEGGWPRPLEREFTGQVVIGAAGEAATIRTLVPSLGPGAPAHYAITLRYPMVITGGERLILRRSDRLIGLGVVIEPLGPEVAVELEAWVGRG